MLLHVGERIALFTILPQKGSFNTLRILREFREALELTPDEKQRFGWTEQGDRVAWTSGEEVNIAIPDAMRVRIVTVLSDLDARSELPANCMSLYEKFIKAEEP